MLAGHILISCIVAIATAGVSYLFESDIVICALVYWSAGTLTLLLLAGVQFAREAGRMNSGAFPPLT
jgi:hypothetical protein